MVDERHVIRFFAGASARIFARAFARIFAGAFPSTRTEARARLESDVSAGLAGLPTTLSRAARA